jgi:Pyruvate/2-oxoacid:ferredoxin oxidoreductase delta subunit
MTRRKIVEIDETRCNGCGLCVPSCAEGAIQIVDGKARLVSDVYCDGLGACLGECPQGAISVVERDAAAFDEAAAHRHVAALRAPSALGNWPIQLHLVPPGAPFLLHADVLLVADCVPFALADFHERYLRGRPVVIACPKLDNTQPYVEKLAAMLTHSSIRSLTVVHMEVPCCMGLVRIAQAARQAAGVDVPLDEVVISTRGEVLPRA